MAVAQAVLGDVFDLSPPPAHSSLMESGDSNIIPLPHAAAMLRHAGEGQQGAASLLP